MPTKTIRGVVALTVNEKGEVMQFSDPQPTRSKAITLFKRERSWLMSGGGKDWLPIHTVTFEGNPRDLESFLNERFAPKP